MRVHFSSRDVSDLGSDDTIYVYKLKYYVGVHLVAQVCLTCIMNVYTSLVLKTTMAPSFSDEQCCIYIFYLTFWSSCTLNHDVSQSKFCPLKHVFRSI